MVSGWGVYWIMQLDQIRMAMVTLSWAGVGVSGLLAIWNWLSIFDTEQFPSLCDPEKRKAACAFRWSVLRVIWPYVAVAFIVSAFVPSSRTAAAIVIVPMVTKVIDAMKPEMRELVELTKGALRSIATPKNDDKDNEAKQ